MAGNIILHKYMERKVAEMICPKCGEEIPGGAARTEWMEIEEKIEERKKKWVGRIRKREKSVKTLVMEIQKLTEEIQRRTAPEDYESVLAYVEGEFIYKRNRGNILRVALERVFPAMAIFFTCMLWFIEQYLGKSIFIGNWILIMCFVFLCLIVAVLVEEGYGPHNREITFYELLYKSLEHRGLRQCRQATKE